LLVGAEEIQGYNSLMVPGRRLFSLSLERPRQKALKVVKSGLLPLARVYRRLHRTTDFIGVTGTCGKTTAKFLIYSVLAGRYPGVCSPGGRNRAGGMLHTFLNLRKRHQFCVIELGAFGPRTLNELISTLEPQVGVVTNVGPEHVSAFGGPDEVAEEKSRLVRSLPHSGWAILNGDDPRVRRMAAATTASVLFYGCGPDNDLRAAGISSRWPERLSFQAAHEGQSAHVKTLLCGEHWVYPVLAALGVGLTRGIPLAEAAEAVAQVFPFRRRMEPFQLDRGITWIRDDWKASSWTIPPALKFLADAQARRRIFALGQVSDDRTKPRRLYPRLAREARQVADQVCLFGQWAHHGLKARSGDGDESVLAFSSATEMAGYLERTLEAGDLLYVKASGRRDPSLDTAFSGEFWKGATRY
jgi:UDP-N-acetylmuramoyl-tripeptide--D-alanyl-D-alanine ligase